MFFVGRAILKPLLWLLYRPVITGREDFPERGAVLIVSNHFSMLDTVLIPSFTPRKVQFLAKSSLFSGVIGRWFFNGIGAVPVNRGSSSAAQEALSAGREVLLDGSVFTVFPEGSRSRDGKLYRGKGGAAWLALETGATVVPVGILGTNRDVRDPRTGKRERVRIHFGAPFGLDDLGELPAGRARREATERMMTEIQALTGQERVDRFAEGSIGA
ncbi:1-acyl-sn-glycerol-3-phosphate acyltransferase [Leucobacter sp. BZR 635]